MKISTISGMGTVALCVGFLTVLAACASGGTTAEQRARRVDETARGVAAAIEGRRLWVDVDYMFPARTAPRSVSGSYGIAVSGDTLRSWLPYIGRAYQLPYGGGTGLAFSALISQDDAGRRQGGGAAVAHAAVQELGDSPAGISAALKGVEPNATTEEMVRHALRAMVMKG